MWQAFAFDGVTGAQIDRLDVSDMSWERVMSNRGNGNVTFPIDGSYTPDQLRSLLRPWSTIVGCSYGGEVVFGGYVTGRGYRTGGHITLDLGDLWAKLSRMGAWDHSAPNVEKWETTVTGNLATHAAQAIIRARDTGPSLPARGLPLTMPGGYPGSSVTRSYYGYHGEMVSQVHTKLLDEGLDIYYHPRFIGNGDFDWLYQAGPGWGSGAVREFMVSAPESPVSRFVEQVDASRVTNNAHRAGEGSERDMLVRSNRDLASPYPALDRWTASKSVTATAQLAAQASNDLVMYGQPTVQWDYDMHISEAGSVGDTHRLGFYDDPWIADGWHERRVVKLAGKYGSEVVTVSVQPTGGA